MLFYREILSEIGEMAGDLAEARAELEQGARPDGQATAGWTLSLFILFWPRSNGEWALVRGRNPELPAIRHRKKQRGRRLFLTVSRCSIVLER
jgi:hypothetical protein